MCIRDSLCNALNITEEQFDKRMKDVKNRWMNPGYSKYTHQVFMTQLSAEECGVFQEKLFKFPGFYIQRRTIRQYSYNSAGHTLGDIGEVSKKDIENDDYYIRGDYIGKQEMCIRDRFSARYPYDGCFLLFEISGCECFCAPRGAAYHRILLLCPYRNAVAPNCGEYTAHRGLHNGSGRNEEEMISDKVIGDKVMDGD